MDEEITKRIIQFIGGYVEYEDQCIWTGDKYLLLNHRGWGAIQYLKNLPCTPEEFHDHLGRFIASAINTKINEMV
jgi:hypothetical protein